jgi:Family of unknown function (DUF6279)
MRPIPGRNVALALLSALLFACGAATKLVYEQADTAVLLLGDGYLDFAGAQSKTAREAVQRFHAWHRRAELPQYAVLLNGAAARVDRGLNRADVEWGIETVRARYAVLVGAAIEEASPFLVILDDGNFDALERRFAADDRKRLREQLSGDAAKRERTRAAAIVKRLEKWTGPLSRDQSEIVQRFVRATADHPRQAHEYRRGRQRDLLALLQHDGGPDKAQLRSFFLAWEADGPARDAEYHARYVELILGLDRSLTSSQRARVTEHLRQYAEDARQLSSRN